MSKRVYATKASQANEFADHDGYGWFKDIRTRNLRRCAYKAESLR